MISYREPIGDQFVAFLEKLIYHRTEPLNLIVAETSIWDTPTVHAFLGTRYDKLRLISDTGQLCVKNVTNPEDRDVATLP